MTPALNIATYDEIRELVLQNEGPVSASRTVSAEKAGFHRPALQRNGQKRNLHRFCRCRYVYPQWGPAIEKEEAFDILAQNEKDGLVLMPSNTRKPSLCAPAANAAVPAWKGSACWQNPRNLLKTITMRCWMAEQCVGCGQCGKNAKPKP
ncbi:MAG: hypothetical protein R2874_02370 [Desulfobacterales bacterium]